MGGRRADELRALIAGAGFKGIPFDRTSNPRPKDAYSSSDLRIVLPELVEAHGADAIKRELIPFCLVSYRVGR
jgi:hypothetical protein